MRPKEIVAIREKHAPHKDLKKSRKLFGKLIGYSPNTIEHWEYGWQKPSERAILMIKTLENRILPAPETITTAETPST